MNQVQKASLQDDVNASLGKIRVEKIFLHDAKAVLSKIEFECEQYKADAKKAKQLYKAHKALVKKAKSKVKRCLTQIKEYENLIIFDLTK